MRMSWEEFEQFVPLEVRASERVLCEAWLRVRGRERRRECVCADVLVQLCRGFVSMWVQGMMGSMGVRWEFRVLATLCDRCAVSEGA